ncbi:MAG TPA: class I SAM-dependent methyltransferase [Microbacterium sp.]|uniref:class I SAM-dependent methyltransferase n=1 Tax=Microbacterium sp. TaxID=51671 RepID=UPI002B9FBE4E|nr:class I SAM-dependent methyltransferase [Microbacterium sp.]HWI32522.1 class I SAM-dependent methyltransferase [Microbacterium sp.]
MASRDEMSTSFGVAAGTYESGRPEYPAEAVEWMLAPVASHEHRPRVADVGAGTGKLTRAVAATGAEVVAIDPDPDMLAALRDAVPGIPTFVGRAERLPLPDAALDAVVLGQAWHWVEPVAGSLEAARVLRSGGILGLIWNVRDESDPWVRRLTAVMHGSHAEVMLEGGDPPIRAPFDALEGRVWHWTRTMTRAAMLDMARSRSYIITAEPGDRAMIEAGLGALLDEMGLHGEATIELPYVTRAYRAVRP